MPWAEGSFGTVARENPLTSAKIISVAGYGQAGTVDSVNYSAGGDNLIAVDDIDIFQEDLDDEYIIYRAGWYQDGEVLRQLAVRERELGYFDYKQKRDGRLSTEDQINKREYSNRLKDRTHPLLFLMFDSDDQRFASNPLIDYEK